MSTHTILLIEDDPDVAESLRRMLAAFGYHVQVASDGAKGLSALRSGLAPALVILDLTMPNLDGWRFREVQRADAALDAIPTVIITADRRVDERALGAAACFLKPFDCEALLAEVARLAGPPLDGAPLGRKGG